LCAWYNLQHDCLPKSHKDYSMNGIYIEYNKLTPYHIEWLDGCGAEWASGYCFSEIPSAPKNVQFTKHDSIWRFNFVSSICDKCKTADEFCKGVAKRLGIEYKAERTEEYFQKKLADKLAEHARADAGFPQKENDMEEQRFGGYGTEMNEDDITSPLSPKEEVKYKHLEECFRWRDGRWILAVELETVIRAVLKDLPQEYVVGEPDNENAQLFRHRMHKLLPGDVGVIFQRIGSITEKVEIVKAGWV
jgi:hypothetical protein